MIALSSTIRSCSYTRNNEFKLYRIEKEAIATFNPDVFAMFFEVLQENIDIYKQHYYHLLDQVNISLYNSSFNKNGKAFDVVLTSPPYGDSRTTVAYGQFSIFTNSWICGLEKARSLDKILMGGDIKRNIKGDIKKGHDITGLISEYIQEVYAIDEKRALEVKSFYVDLAISINKVAEAIKRNGYSIYIVGNRIVKGVSLPTDRFIAEQFNQHGLKHVVTYERVISNKRMPKLNSPTNEVGKKMSTMNQEYIVVCQKVA